MTNHALASNAIMLHHVDFVVSRIRMTQGTGLRGRNVARRHQRAILKGDGIEMTDTAVPRPQHRMRRPRTCHDGGTEERHPGLVTGIAANRIHHVVVYLCTREGRVLSRDMASRTR